MRKCKRKQIIDGQRKLTPVETLPVYHEFRKFRKYMFVAVEKMPKWMKHSAGADCNAAINICVRCLSVVSRTYDRNLKFEAIDRFLSEWDAISDLITLFSDVNVISSHQCEVMYRMRENIEEQVSSLRTWLLGQPTQEQHKTDSK